MEKYEEEYNMYNWRSHHDFHIFHIKCPFSSSNIYMYHIAAQQSNTTL